MELTHDFRDRTFHETNLAAINSEQTLKQNTSNKKFVKKDEMCA